MPATPKKKKSRTKTNKQKNQKEEEEEELQKKKKTRLSGMPLWRENDFNDYNLCLGGIPNKDATLHVASTLARTWALAFGLLVSDRVARPNHSLDSWVHVY